ncbi:MAG: NAD/NADP octopine/nopaline dehydrogenase family protein [Armatimonadetes bacterium]|nr:NAD/NADP octopine/nopaline dehydrogenase family protein [Armatimonadota bacterium]
MPSHAASRDHPIVAVLGAGNGGLATAADLTRRGCRVHLYDLPEFAAPLEPVREAGIRVHGALPEAVYRPALITTEIAEALDGVSVALLIAPAFAHPRLAEVVLPPLRDDQVLLLYPGAVGGAMEVYQALRTSRPGCRAIIGEVANLGYSAKRDGPASVRINGIKRGVPAAAIPAVRTGEMFDAWGAIFPEFVPARDVLETGLNNINIIVHPVLMLANLSRVENEEEWFTYGDGFTPAVARLMEGVDRERLAVLRALGLPEVSIAEWMVRYYAEQGVKGTELYQVLSTAPVFSRSTGPRAIQDRYLSEDVPYGLVPVASIAAGLGVPAPCTEGLVALASAATDIDYAKTGRNAERLGLVGLSPEQIIARVTQGDYQRPARRR